MSVAAEGTDIDNGDVDLTDLIHRVRVFYAVLGHIRLQCLNSQRIVAHGHKTGVRDVGVEHTGLDLALGLGPHHLDGALHRAQQSLFLGRAAGHLDTGAEDRAEEHYHGGGLVLRPLPSLLHHTQAEQPQIQLGVVLMQLHGKLVNGLLERLAVRSGQLVVELVPGVNTGLPGQLMEVHLAQLAEALVLGVQVLHRFVKGLHSHLLALFQHDGRAPAVGEEVVVAEGRQRRLHGVGALGVHLFQGDGRDGDLALGDVAQAGVQAHLPRDVGQHQVGVQCTEGLPHMGLLAEHGEAGQQLADAAVIDVAVFIAGGVVGGVVGVDARHILEVFFFLQLLQQVQSRDDALGVVLLVALADGQQVAIQLLGMLGEILDQVHMAGYAGLHVQRAAAKQILAGLDVVNDLLRQHECLAQLGGQFLAAEGILADGAKIVHPHGVDVADEDDRAVRIALGALHIGQRTMPHHEVVLGLEALDLLGVRLKVG